jgi:betaine-aldehyde dehydrogenase
VTTTATTTTEELAQLIGTAATVENDIVHVASLVGGTRIPGSAEAEKRVSPGSRALHFINDSSDAADTDVAIDAVRRGFDTGDWGRMSGRDRSRVLWRASSLIADASERLAELLTIEAGKPVREARGEVGSLVNSLEYFAGLARTVGGRTENDIQPGLLAMTLREPAGVAGLIIPWNFPIGILAQKLPPALAAGNTVIIKPSPLTPLSALAVAEILFAAGLPTDALSVVLGDGAAGGRIVDSASTDVISFTGSTGVGRIIARSAGTNRLKPVAIEAGGKTPVVVLDSADLDATVEGILFSAYFNQGQVCVAGSRILAQAGIADELIDRLATRVPQIRTGDPRDEATEVGPLISEQHYQQVIGRLKDSVAAGAEIVTGGGGDDIAGPAGPFLTPTVLRTRDDSNPSITEEIFGPVTAVQTFASVDEVVTRSNAQLFGLAASIWGQDIDSAFDIARRLRVGTVWLNGSTDSFPELPLGGRRDSGFSPEFGREGLDFFTALKTVMVRTGGPTTPWYGAR